jgi:RNA polymerase sigma factor (sigma-70 family)
LRGDARLWMIMLSATAHDTAMNSAASYGDRSSRELLRLARDGDSCALSTLWARQKSALQHWARGRLPHWARQAVDTQDLIQDALLRTFRRINTFQDRGRGALQAYLREAVRNRICDELRKVGRQPEREELSDVIRDEGASPFDLTLDAEQMNRYKTALSTLTENERLLIVGRIEMAYTYEQLALATGRSNAEAARIAVRRALLKLAQKMAG